MNDYHVEYINTFHGALPVDPIVAAQNGSLQGAFSGFQRDLQGETFVRRNLPSSACFSALPRFPARQGTYGADFETDFALAMLLRHGKSRGSWGGAPPPKQGVALSVVSVQVADLIWGSGCPHHLFNGNTPKVVRAVNATVAAVNRNIFTRRGRSQSLAVSWFNDKTRALSLIEERVKKWVDVALSSTGHRRPSAVLNPLSRYLTKVYVENICDCRTRREIAGVHLSRGLARKLNATCERQHGSKMVEKEGTDLDEATRLFVIGGSPGNHNPDDCSAFENSIFLDLAQLP